MSVKPKDHISQLQRLRNVNEDRSNYLRLDKNENLTGFSDDVIEDFHRHITSDFVTTYPDAGTLYRKIGKRLGLDVAQIYLSSGSDGGIKSVFEAYVEPDDQVLVISPTYAMYYVYVEMFQANLQEICFDPGFVLPVERVLDKIGPRTKLICIANPNSPTGTVFLQEELAQILRKAEDSDALLLVDEAYHEYYGETVLDLLGESKHLLVTRTFSKAFGLASARLGFAVSCAEVIENLFKTRPMYEVNSFAVALGSYLMDRPELVAEHVSTIRASQDYLNDEVKKLGLALGPSLANFVLVDVGGPERSSKIRALLAKEKIIIKGGFREPCMQPYIGIGLGSISQMKYFVGKLATALKVSTTGP